MAGIITVTNNSMVKEVPVEPTLQAATAKSLGYKSSAGISFAAADKSINIASGFSAAGFDGCDGEMLLISGSTKNDGLYTVVSDTDTKIIVTEAIVEEAAGATVVLYGVAVYKITPTRRMGQGLIVYSEGVEAAGEVGMIPCILNGAFWAANAGLYTAFAATLATDKTIYLWVETSKFLQADGTILVMLKPIATKQLYTDHRPALTFIELP